MAQFNAVTFIGRLTADPELRFTQSETAVCDVSVAINEKRKDASGSTTEATHFIPVTLWGKLAETCEQHLRKGALVLVSGKLRQESWETDGQKRSKLKVVATDVQFLGTPSGNGSQQQEAVPAGAPEDDVPF